MGKQIYIPQDSAKWHEWRNTGIGSSDAAAILGLSPWKTRDQVLVEKVTGESHVVVSYPMQRGKTLEPVARDLYERESLLHFPASLFSHEEFDYIIASTDGWNEEHKLVLEIKCPLSKADLFSAKGSQIPEKYISQCQHLLLVTGAEWLHYVSFDGENNSPILLRSDEIMQKRMLKEYEIFWNEVEEKKHEFKGDEHFSGEDEGSKPRKVLSVYSDIG